MSRLVAAALLVTVSCARLGSETDPRTIRIDFGEVLSGTVHVVNASILNQSDESAYIFGLQKSCGCLSADISPGALAPNESREIVARIAVTAGKKTISERLIVQSDSPAIDGTEIRITATVVEGIVFTAPFGSETFVSEQGGSGVIEFVLPLPSVELLDQLAESLRQTGLSPAGTLLPIIVDPEASYVDVAAQGGAAVVHIVVKILPNSFRGRFPYYYLEYPLPPTLGGGHIKCQVDVSLIPVVNIGIRPIVKWVRTPESKVFSVIVFASPEESTSTIRFPIVKNTQENGIHWEVILDSSSGIPRHKIVATASSEVISQLEDTAPLSVPFHSGEFSGNLSIWLVK